MKNDILHALEEYADGVFNKEIEHVFYARITDFKQLERADSKVRQEQWEIRLPLTPQNAAKGSIRVRSVKEEGKPIQYVLTSKVVLNEKGDKMEVSVDTTADQFVQFKFLSAQGMIKDRYTFKTEDGLVWEIDVFIDQSGGYYQWCKIDLEVDSRFGDIPPFPIEFHDVINATAMERNSKEDKQVSDLYDRYFLTKNLYKRDPTVKAEREEIKENKNEVQQEVVLD